jgi:hypothetical protein
LVEHKITPSIVLGIMVDAADELSCASCVKRNSSVIPANAEIFAPYSLKREPAATSTTGMF